jgi:hypothetical protein
MAYAIYTRARLHPLANPVLLAVVAIGMLLTATHTGYATFGGAQFVHFLLGPAVVRDAAARVRRAEMRRCGIRGGRRRYRRDHCYGADRDVAPSAHFGSAN